ncbi:ASCH domain-containing protein [Paenibacillus alvei]|uniref:ASCH domain-containing protein n=1 Tax=Paenibacillus alvei TaxID=44250 RepID=A0ABT4GQH5_PAEAL|nr:ASCH domain-containing protein [Paenibacillus alvei]MCY9758948.1 ASCH domain-containing protein [Paenibacillus alvei]MCY9770621.1 ASCH domain-containing protein [Paenibacillus alvei]
MKAITIIQPWATLIAIGEKRFETRSWPTKHRGEIAIHAGKKIDKEACEDEPIRSTLAKHGYTVNNLPTGAVVAIAELNDCLKSVDTWTDGYELEFRKLIYYPEYEFGDFTPGRYAWEMINIRCLAEPIQAKGQQGLWNWNSEGHGGTES